MEILHKIKKMLFGESTAPTKTTKPINTNSNVIKPNNVTSNEFKTSIDDKPQIIDAEVVEVKQNQVSIVDVFSENEEYVFKDIIWANLFNEENKYSDNGILVKTQKYLKKYFEEKGFDWYVNSETLQKLITSSAKWKALAKQQDTFYEYYCTNRINLRFEGHFLDWVKFVIDESYKANKPLTKQYARTLVGFYYFKAFHTKGSKEALYKNPLAMISYDEFRNWVSKDDGNRFERLVKFVIKRFSKMDVQDLDERVLIIQLIKSINFKKALDEFEYLDSSAKQSIYANIYNEANEETQVKSIDLNVKNIITEGVHSKNNETIKTAPIQSKIETKDTKKTNNEISKLNIADSLKVGTNEEIKIHEARVEEQKKVTTSNIINLDVKDKEMQPKEKTVASEKSEIMINDTQKFPSEKIENVVETSKPNNSTDEENIEAVKPIKKTTRKVSTKEDDFDKALKKLGGTRNVEETDEVLFLNSIVEELENIEREIVVSIDMSVEQPYDEEIEDLLYF